MEEEKDENEDEEGNIKKYWIEDPGDCNIDHLEKVTFTNFKGLNAELELIKCILAHFHR